MIIGAGIMGLSIAYHLARHHGIRDVTVVDRSYLCGGASGRNGGGVRAQWSSEANVRLMQESIRMCRDFAGEMKINVWFRQGGYLFLVRTEERRRALEASVRVQNDCGLTTRMLTPHEAQKTSSPSSTRAASWPRASTPTTASSFRGRSSGATREAAKKLGVEVATFTDVVGFDTRGAPHRRRGDEPRKDSNAPGRERGRRVEPRGRAPARRRAPEPAASSRDLLDRAAEAVALAARRRPDRTGSTSRSRRAARSSAASSNDEVPRGHRPALVPSLSRALRARADRARAPSSAR